MQAKNICLTVWILLVLGTLNAQDIIITKDAGRIEAKILEVSQSEIKYRQFSNPEGPACVMAAEEVQSITYANGEVQTFDNQDIQVNKAALPDSQGDQEQQAEAAPKTVVHYGNLTGGKIKRDKNNYYNADGTSVSEAEYLEFIRTQCPVAYDFHINGIMKEKLGKIFCCVSAGFSLASICCLCIVLAGNDNFTLIPSLCFLGGAVGFLVVGIPIWQVGKRQQRFSYEIYNQQCAERLSLNLQSGRNGIGLALRF